MVSEQKTVVLIHGLYMHGAMMIPLARRLRQFGYRIKLFSTPSVRRSPLENAHALAQTVKTLDVPTLHFVAHSLGGIVVWHLFQRSPDQPPGRVVTLGTPFQGSYTARTINAGRLRFVLGRSVEQGLLDRCPSWPFDQQLGSLAGTLNRGLGRLLADVPVPCDGSVSVAETCIPGMTDHICLPVSHTGMLFAPSVADQIHGFLTTGRFLHRR